jgi:hypothetical protein
MANGHSMYILDAKRLASQAYDKRKKEKALRKVEESLKFNN